MTCTCKVFSTLILDSRYFYSQEKKNKSVSFSCLMLRDSCLYSSLACSVYSIVWVSLFSHFKSHADIYWTYTLICDLFCWKYICTFLNSWGEVINSQWINLWENLPNSESLKQSYMTFGAVSKHTKQSLNVTCSVRWSVEVWALFHCADAALTSLGLWFRYGWVCSFLLSSSQMESGTAWKHRFLNVYFTCLTCVLTEESYAETSLGRAVGWDLDVTHKTSYPGSLFSFLPFFFFFFFFVVMGVCFCFFLFSPTDSL